MTMSATMWDTSNSFMRQGVTRLAAGRYNDRTGICSFFIFVLTMTLGCASAALGGILSAWARRSYYR